MASVRDRKAYVKALLREIGLQKDFFDVRASGKVSSSIKTIYFGGGTPSVLPSGELWRIFEELARHFSLTGNEEVTLEANPDDLTPAKLRELRGLPVNRLSIGVQSFFAEDLQYMNRVHSPIQAWQSIRDALEAGFENISVDLIYGTPTLTDANWEHNLHRLAMQEIPHISAYALTVEPRTPLAWMIRKGRALPVSGEQSARQFDIMKDLLEAYGYRHYEISNFSFPGRESLHNTSYWTGVPYLGLGSSAHSFTPGRRSWNISQIRHYIASISAGRLPYEEEILTTEQSVNEYIMTSLRTIWGCDLDYIARTWGPLYVQALKKSARPHLERGVLFWKDEHTLVLGRKGLFLADGIAASLFM